MVTCDAGPDGAWTPRYHVQLSDAEARRLALALALAGIEDDLAWDLIRQLPPTRQPMRRDDGRPIDHG